MPSRAGIFGPPIFMPGQHGPNCQLHWLGGRHSDLDGIVGRTKCTHLGPMGRSFPDLAFRRPLWGCAL